MLGGEEIPVPAMFSDQEVPENKAEQQPEEAPKITSLPVADNAAFEVEEKLLYSDLATPASEHALTVDNEDVQRFLNLGEIFSFHHFEESKDELFPVSESMIAGYSYDSEPEEGASNPTVAPDILTDSTFPSYHAGVADALSHNGNEFAPTQEKEMLQTEGECFQLGRGESPPTFNDRKENSEDKTYLYPVRLPCSDASEAQLPRESQLLSLPELSAASPDSKRSAER